MSMGHTQKKQFIDKKFIKNYYMVVISLVKNMPILKHLEFTLESRIIGGVGIIGRLDIVIIINNRGDWNNRRD